MTRILFKFGTGFENITYLYKEMGTAVRLAERYFDVVMLIMVLKQIYSRLLFSTFYLSSK